MKIALICAALLSATTVGAATTSIEDPDHSYIKSTRVQSATPVTGFGATVPPLNPVKERASIELLIRQLELDMIPKEGETPDQTALRQQAASERMKRIDKLKALLQQLPGQSVHLN